mmetsp:Transcript_2092/g.3473  ORF Transcript_2092/g.3473 Transcript_2092/m.3473 type:complete len:300 (-) Transcript_2092:186-1085(-)
MMEVSMFLGCMQLPRRWFSLLLCSILLSGSFTDITGEFVEDYQLHLEPFQILLEYDNVSPTTNSDEMLVLETTQRYLSLQLQTTEADFSRLILYQFVRDYVMESRDHFSKIAMNGVVFFSTPNTPTRQSRVQLQIMKDISTDSESYVAMLRAAGLNHVVNATLLSIQGNEMMFENGEMVEMDEAQPADVNEESSRDMGDEMRRRMMLLLCLVVPGSALFLAVVVFMFRFLMTHEINWRASTSRDAKNEDKMWRSNEIHCGDDTGASSKHMGSRKGILPSSDSHEDQDNSSTDLSHDLQV